MGRFKNTATGVVFSVDDSKDARYAGLPGYEDPEGADAPEPGPYDGLKLDELKAEIEKRNEGREDDAKVSTAGKKADLAAALVADDNKS